MPRRLVTAVLVPVALAVTVSGCSSSKSSTASPTGGKTSAAAKASASAASGTNLLQSAYAKTSAAKSARVAVTIRSGGGAMTALNSDISGVVDFAQRSAQISTKLPAIGTAEVRIIHGVSYVHLPTSFTSKVKTFKPWIRTSSNSLGNGDPTQVLGFLQAAGSMSRVGTETVRGTSATHYRGMVNVAKLAATSGSAAKAAAVKKLYGSTAAPVDIWVDAAGRAVRVRTTFPAPKIGATGATKGTISSSADYYDFGVPVHVVTPPKGQVSSVTLPGASG